MKLSEKKLIAMIRRQYKQRLAEVAISAELKETDVFDKRGNMLLSKGLKVRHKGSGYEYTVDHIEGEGEESVIFLRHPDQPRFEPATPNKLEEAGKTVIKLDGVDLGRITGNDPSGEKIDNVVSHRVDHEKNTDIKLPKTSLLKITKKEFEADYEVD